MYLTVIDFSYLFHKSYHIVAYNYKLNNKDENGEEKRIDLEDPVNRGLLARKVMIDMCRTINELNSDNVVFCFDHRSFRYDLLETYKEGRGEKPQGFDSLMDELYSILTSKGYNTLKVPNLEADDCISLVVKDVVYNNYLKIIVTKDEDAQQLLNKKTMVYVPDAKKKVFYYSSEELLLVKPKEGPDYHYERVDPDFILFMKIMKGCTSDKIPQITPKGYRTKKIEAMYSILQDDLLSNEPYLPSLMKAVNSQDISFTDEQIQTQLRLVCLDGEFMPEEAVDYYISHFVLNEEKKEYNFIDILKGTGYVDEEYQQNK